MNSIFDYLQTIKKKYHNVKYRETDPVRFIYRFENKIHREFTGLLFALFSYGNIKSMFRFMEHLYEFLKPDPINIVLDLKDSQISHLYYRFQNKRDIVTILRVFREIVIENLNQKFLYKNLFYKNNYSQIYELIDTLRENSLKRIPRGLITEGIQHYFTSSGESVCKRYCLFFRWMVRDKFPDSGIYYFLEKSKLIYPVDVHIANFAYQYQIIKTRTVNRKHALEITNFFKKIEPDDPLIFDFYITREPVIKKYFAHMEN